MIRSYVLIVFFICTAGILAAQETPKFDLFGGYSFARAKSLSTGNLNGWDSSLTYNLNSWLGFTAEGSGHYGSHELSPRTIVVNCPPLPLGCSTNVFGPDVLNSKLHTYTVGPQFTWRTSHPLTPFAHVLVGGLHDSANI